MRVELCFQWGVASSGARGVELSLRARVDRAHRPQQRDQRKERGVGRLSVWRWDGDPESREQRGGALITAEQG